MSSCFVAGKIYSIRGENGAGKSTLINLLLGLYINCYRGEIIYNGIDINKIDLVDLRNKLVGVTEQIPLLLNDTLYNNLLMGSKNFELMNFLIDYFQLNDFISRLENGINNVINESTTNISGGEKQKIAIIRQLISNPDVMIFDEPTASLDFDSKNKFLKYITKIKANKIIIIITHDDIINDFSDETITIKINSRGQ